MNPFNGWRAQFREKWYDSHSFYFFVGGGGGLNWGASGIWWGISFIMIFTLFVMATQPLFEWLAGIGEKEDV